MACPHYQIRIISRRDGESVVAAAAYQARTNIFNEYRQQTENGNGSGEVVHTEIMLPANAPHSYLDRAVLWNAVEKVEAQCNSQLARCIKLAIPVELPREQWTDLVLDYVRKEFVSKGMCADVAIHYKEPPPNPHAHILLTMREMDEHGQWLPKFRKIPCNDDAGNPVFDAKGHMKMRAVSINDWNDRGNADIWRQDWAAMQNAYLEKNGSDVRVDLRSYKRQGIAKIGKVHLGRDASAIVRKGGFSFLQQLNDDIDRINPLIAQACRICAHVSTWLKSKREERNAKKRLQALTHDPPFWKELYAWWTLRCEQRDGWKSGAAKVKCMCNDWRMLQEMERYLTERKLFSTGDILDQCDTMEAEDAEMRKALSAIERRLSEIEKLTSAYQTVEELKPVSTKAKFGFPAQREKYAAAHAEELKKFNKAYAQLLRLNGKAKIDLPALKEEAERLTAEKERLSARRENLKPDLIVLRRFRKWIKAVYTDLDHDDRKPSIMEQLRNAERDQQRMTKSAPLQAETPAL